MSDRHGRSTRLVAVDILRALAALWVVVHHVPFFSGQLDPEASFWLSVPFRFGYCGVTVFLVISGFCIHLTAARRLASGEAGLADWGKFWKRRIWRLYPPYLAAIAFSVAVLLTVGSPAYRSEYQRPPLALDLITHLLLIHNLLADCYLGLGNAALWSLGLEEQLYALYALFLAMRRRFALGPVVGFSLVVSLLWISGWKWVGAPAEWGGNHPSWKFGPFVLGEWMMWPFAWWFAWNLGAVAAEAYTGVAQLPKWCASYRAAFVLALAAIACNRIMLQHFCLVYSGTVEKWSLLLGISQLERILVVVTTLSEFLVAGASFVLLNRWIQHEQAGGFRSRIAKSLSAVGVMSYSLYLIHMPVLHVVEGTFHFGEGPGSMLLRFASMTTACLAVAAVFYFAVERHFLNTRASSKRQSAPRPVQAIDGRSVSEPIASAR